jgi:hypothetical protein
MTGVDASVDLREETTEGEAAADKRVFNDESYSGKL